MRSRNPVIELLLLPIVMAGVVLVGCTKKDREETTIGIGILAPLTGDAASWGEEARKGYDLAMSEINQAGGIAGNKIRLIYEDTQASPEKGSSAMLKLTTIDKVPAVLGDIVSSVTLAAAPIAERNQVVLLSPTSSAPKISEAGKYIFRIWPSDIAEGTAIANFAAAELRLKNMAIMAIQNDYGLALTEVFKKAFANGGGQIPSVVRYKQEETDFRPHLTQIQAAEPKALYLVSYYKDAALILKQARELNLNILFLATTAVQDPKLIEIAGTAADGLVYPLSSGYDPNAEDPIVTGFKDDYQKKYQQEPGFVAAQCFDAVKLIAHVMSKGALTGPSIQQGLEEVNDYHGVTGLINFDENGDVVKETEMKKVKDGQFVPYADG